MSNLGVDIDTVKSILSGNLVKKKETYYGLFEKIYPFTNENLFACFNNFNVLNKECLTVLGSSDQTFDLFLRGAKSVDVFDVNPLTKYYFDLKKAALLSDVSLEEYLSFLHFNIKGLNHILISDENKRIFYKVLKYLSEDSIKFWVAVYSYILDNSINNYSIFKDEFYSDNTLKKSIYYLKSQDNFKKLKSISSNININFYNVDIKDLKYVLTKNYDFMYFSNIVEYSKEMFPDSKYEGYDKFINLCFDIIKNLRENGEAVIGYLFNSYYLFRKYNCLIFNNSERKIEKLEVSSGNYITCNPEYLKESNPICLVYKKGR